MHRIGRTKSGKIGKIHYLCGGKEIYRLEIFSGTPKSKFPREPCPLGEVQEAKYNVFLDDIRATLDEGSLEPYVDLVEQLIQETTRHGNCRRPDENGAA